MTKSASKRAKVFRNIKPKLRLLDTYEKRVGQGQKGYSVIEKLATRGSMSERTLQRYLKEARDWRDISPEINRLTSKWISQFKDILPTPDEMVQTAVKSARDYFFEISPKPIAYDEEEVMKRFKSKTSEEGRVFCDVENEPLFGRLWKQLPRKFKSYYKRWGKESFTYGITLIRTFFEILATNREMLETEGCSPELQLAFARTIIDDTLQPTSFGYATRRVSNRYLLKFGKDLIAQSESPDQLEIFRSLHSKMRESYRQNFSPTKTFQKLEELKSGIIGQLRTISLG